MMTNVYHKLKFLMGLQDLKRGENVTDNPHFGHPQTGVQRNVNQDVSGKHRIPVLEHQPYSSDLAP